MPEPRELTPSEQKVVQEFESARPGLGAMPSAVRSATIAESNIRNNDKTGWADIIVSMDESELVASSGTASNSFIYRRLGG
jgi:hypothetical protein